jgi:creatinine amidohydrolase
MREWDLAKLTWQEAQQAVADAGAVLVPVGSFEQHGPHTPMDVDTVIARHLAAQVAQSVQARGGYVVVGPTISLGVSWYHMDFAGTVSLEPTLFIEVVREVCRSLHHHGFRNLVLLNAHGGNYAALNLAINLVRDELRANVYHVSYWELVGDLTGKTDDGLVHAGEVETSVCLAIGMKVYMHLATREAADRRETLEGLGAATSRYVRYDAHHRGPQVNIPMHHIAEFSRSGVVGDATLARKDLGEELLRVVVDRMGEFLMDISRPPKAAGT